jgi:hypothetical protein
VVLSVFGGVVGTILGSGLPSVSSMTPVPAAIEAWSVASDWHHRPGRPVLQLYSAMGGPA